VQAQCLVNLDDALKGSKIAFCEAAVEFNFGHDDVSVWQQQDSYKDLLPRFLVGAL
jgi:hypothetical protein